MSLRSSLTVVQSNPPCSAADLFFIIDAEPMDSQCWQPLAAYANCEVVAVHGRTSDSSTKQIFLREAVALERTRRNIN